MEKIQNLKENGCIVDFLLNEVRVDECRICGKRVFGYESITQLEITLNDITEKEGRSSDLSLIEELCGLVKTQFLCGTGEEIADAVPAVVETYYGDFEEHIGKKGCKADICRKLMTYHILVDRYTDRGDYMDECEEDTALGKKRFVHVTDQNERTRYGAYMSVCREDTVVKVGAVKPKCPRKPIPCRW